ncbi:bystin protein [Besnoitia besnoiti]|uniref:Bystin protein n=1 Tax=Besnoitia besnoiti TaxID=94643 RepID=A0A2A9M6Y5_BESBE|nr:bystin protein [Besnoitia besnoiti]PFH32954.1 bystin protein [Besnoitia besnoiti]
MKRRLSQRKRFVFRPFKSACWGEERSKSSSLPRVYKYLWLLVRLLYVLRPKVKSEKRKVASRHNPLHVDILGQAGVHTPETAVLLKKGKKPKTGVHEAFTEDGSFDADEDGVVPQKLSKKILRLVEEQQLDDRADGHDSEGSEDEGSEPESDGEDEHVDEDGFVVIEGEEDEEDELYVQRRQKEQGAAAAAAPTLADFILEKLRQKEQAAVQGEAPVEEDANALPPKVVEVYTAMGPFLQKYRSGRMPKAFKVLPRLQRWEEVLLLTEPQNWSKQAMFEATKIFSSNLSSAGAQRFLCLVLLPAVRDDISANKKLNYHLYQALKKALFKPAAFFKGIFLPLALEGCSNRESIIVGSVVAKVSIPVLHGAAALMRLALVPPSHWLPAVSVLMGILINKKYSLPVKAVQACAAHFHQFEDRAESLPVSWHKALLVFVQRYKFCLSDTERNMLKAVLRVHFHEKIGPEIRRELLAKNAAQVLQQQQQALMDQHSAQVAAASGDDVEMGA